MLENECAANPLQPTSRGMFWALQPCLSAIENQLCMICSLLLVGLPILSSHGTVSLRMTTSLWHLDDILPTGGHRYVYIKLELYALVQFSLPVLCCPQHSSSDAHSALAVTPCLTKAMVCLSGWRFCYGWCHCRSFQLVPSSPGHAFWCFHLSIVTGT